MGKQSIIPTEQYTGDDLASARTRRRHVKLAWQRPTKATMLDWRKAVALHFF